MDITIRPRTDSMSTPVGRPGIFLNWRVRHSVSSGSSDTVNRHGGRRAGPRMQGPPGVRHLIRTTPGKAEEVCSDKNASHRVSRYFTLIASFFAMRSRSVTAGIDPSTVIESELL